MSFEFTCDPADDTSTEARDVVPETPAPGTAYVVRGEAVFTSPEVGCGTERGDTVVQAGSCPHFLRAYVRGRRVLLGRHSARGRSATARQGLTPPRGHDPRGLRLLTMSR